MRILYLDLDTLRPDHLGCYGYQRNTSPNIDAIAAQGTRFTNYYCSDAPCLPSRTALMTGRFGIHTGVVNHGGTNADPRPEGPTRLFHDSCGKHNLPMLFRDAGLKTISISPFAERHSAWSFYAGFSEMHNTGENGMESAEEVTPTVLNWIHNNADDDNWFLQVNYWDAHHPYRAPEEFGNPFENDPLPEWLTEETLEKHRKEVGGKSAREVTMFTSNTNPKYPRSPGELKTMDDVRAMIDGYDCGVRYMDGHLGQIFDALREKGILDDIAIIISSDHGENMGELGLWAEHGTADNTTCKVPMIIRWPGTKANQVDDGLHYNLDLGPTLADMLNAKPSPNWDGQSYAPVLQNGTACGRDTLVLSQCSHGAQRSVRFDDYMYIRTYHGFYHLFERDMLFNVKEDPHEQKNLAEEKPEVVREAIFRYLDWHDEMMKSMNHNADPLWEVLHEGGPFHARGKLPQYCKRLEETDRGWAVPKLKEMHPEEFR